VRLDLLCGLSVIGAYVPNSGASLQRLTYRVDGWDESLRRHLEKLDGQNAVLLCGDLNTAHEDSDIWNPEDSRMPRQAGTTPEERASFAKTLHELGFVDAWRWQHPNAKGVYSYWSQRNRSRLPNCGLRLDYFLGSRRLFPEAGRSDISQMWVHDCCVHWLFLGLLLYCVSCYGQFQ
ncbi:unnamed protein product, partial [Polarella glacialis]